MSLSLESLTSLSYPDFLRPASHQHLAVDELAQMEAWRGEYKASRPMVYQTLLEEMHATVASQLSRRISQVWHRGPRSPPAPIPVDISVRQGAGVPVGAVRSSRGTSGAVESAVVVGPTYSSASPDGSTPGLPECE